MTRLIVYEHVLWPELYLGKTAWKVENTLAKITTGKVTLNLYHPKFISEHISAVFFRFCFPKSAMFNDAMAIKSR